MAKSLDQFEAQLAAERKADKTKLDMIEKQMAATKKSEAVMYQLMANAEAARIAYEQAMQKEPPEKK